MRTLVAASSVAAAFVGGAAALTWHYLRLLHGDFGWFAYSPVSGEVHVDTGSWALPLLAGLVVGGLAGLAAGLLLVRAGWRLVRTVRDDAGA